MSGTTGVAPSNGNGSRTKGLLLIAVVFLLGLVCGSALTVIGVRTVLPIPGRADGPPQPDRGMMRHLATRLDLDDEQREQVRAILEESRLEMERVFEDSGERIREILTEEQAERFDEMRRHRRHRPGGGGPRFGRGPGREPPPPPPPGGE